MCKHGFQPHSHILHTWAPPLLLINSNVCHKFSNVVIHCSKSRCLPTQINSSISLYSQIREKNDQPISSCKHWQVDWWEWKFIFTTCLQQINVSWNDIWSTNKKICLNIFTFTNNNPYLYNVLQVLLSVEYYVCWWSKHEKGLSHWGRGRGKVLINKSVYRIRYMTWQD